MPSSPAVLAGGQLGLLSRSEVAVAGAAAEDLLEALGRVPDPRDPRGPRYPLVPVLAIAVCAMLAGARSYAAIAEWAADAPPRLRARLGLPGPVPDLATIWRVLTTVDPAAVDRAAGAWVSAQLAAQQQAAQVVLAVDGKTVRGARTGDGTVPHLLACLDHGAGVMLAQVAADGKTNEITVFTALLAQAGGLDGVLVTADAMHAQREHATWLHERGAHYLVTVSTPPCSTSTCSRWFSLSAVLQAGQAGDVAELAVAEIAACLCDFGLGVHSEKAAICDEFLDRLAAVDRHNTGHVRVGCSRDQLRTRAPETLPDAGRIRR